MRRIKYRISLDMFEVASQTTIKAKKGDTACSIHVTLTENGKIYHIVDGCHAVFSAKKSDGNYLFNGETCRIEDNTIIYDFTKQTTPVEGIVECELILYKGEDRLTSPRFNLKVDSTVYNGEEIVSSPEADALKDLTDRAEEIVNQYDEGVIVGKKYVDNNFANALKGSASGKAVAIKDVSPLQHDIKVKYDDTITLLDGWLPNDGGVIGGSNHYAFDGGADKFELRTKTKIPSYWGLVFATDQDTMNGGTASEIFGVNEDCYWYVQYSNNEFLFAFYRDAEMTDLILETSQTCAYPNTKILTVESYGEDNVEVVITQEIGGVSVNVYGKNLLPDDIYNINNWVKVPYTGGPAAIYDLELKNNVKYTISGNISKNGAYVYFYKRLKGTNHESENSETKMLGYLVSGTSNFTNYTFTADDKYVYYVWLWSLNLSNSLSTLTNLQLEVDTATDYEPYKEPVTYTANVNGEVEIPSQYPSMTIIPDLDVELSVEYNRDINKAFAMLEAAITNN